jgi:hypothetical protein
VRRRTHARRGFTFQFKSRALNRLVALNLEPINLPGPLSKL